MIIQRLLKILLDLGPQKHHRHRLARTPVGCFLFKPLGPVLKFPLRSSIHGLPCDAIMFTGHFLKFILAPFP